MTDGVRIETAGATTTITIDRPEARNPLTLGVLGAMREAFEAASADPAIRCVVLTGAGGSFCAGADLRHSVANDPQFLQRLDVYMDAFHGLVRALVRCDKPVVAMVDGAAIGFGADLAFA